MIEYLVKFGLVSAILYTVYLLILEKESIYKFNRFYLLAIVALALVIPITIVKTEVITVPAQEFIEVSSPALASTLETEPFYLPETVPTSVSKSYLTTEVILWLVYSFVSLVFLFRFSRNLLKIRQLRISGTIINHGGQHIVLRSDIHSSFSFLNTIFTNKERYMNGHIPAAIIAHELVHVRQKHSWDIIIIELIQAALWFNPVIFFIKRSIKLNHEFLADAHTLQGSTSLRTYQELLIKHSTRNLNNSPELSSPINYSLTKKRLQMMAKNTTQLKAATLSLCAIIAIILSFWFLGETRIIAQEEEIKVDLNVSEDSNNTQGEAQEATFEILFPVSLALDQKAHSSSNIKYTTLYSFSSSMRYKAEDDEWIEAEFNKISLETKRKIIDNNWSTEFLDSSSGEWISCAIRYKEKIPLNQKDSKVQKTDTAQKKPNHKYLKPNNKVRFNNTKGERIEKLYKDLTPSELERFKQNEAKPAYFLPPPPRGYVPDNFAEQFSNEKEYGVWLDGKKINNSELKNYSANEIHHYYKSALLKNAKNYGVHTFQLNVYTDKYMEGKPDGTWINLLTIPEGGIQKLKEQKNSNKSGNGPFPSYVFHDDTKTRWVDEKGHVVKSTEKKGTEEFQFYVPPVKSKPISAETLQKYISNPQYHLWLNNEPVHAKHELEISADEIHHTQDIFSKGIHQLNIITKNYSKIEEIENGFWVTVPKEHVSQLITSSTDSK